MPLLADGLHNPRHALRSWAVIVSITLQKSLCYMTMLKSLEHHCMSYKCVEWLFFHVTGPSFHVTWPPFCVAGPCHTTILLWQVTYPSMSYDHPSTSPDHVMCNIPSCYASWPSTCHILVNTCHITIALCPITIYLCHMTTISCRMPLLHCHPFMLHDYSFMKLDQVTWASWSHRCAGRAPSRADWMWRRPEGRQSWPFCQCCWHCWCHQTG